MRFAPGQVAAITGAGSGFGRELALILAKRGLHLGLSDVNLRAVEETAELCRRAAPSAASPPRILAARCDVSRAAEVADFARAVGEELATDGRVDFVAANAGIGSWGYCANEPLEVCERVLGINLLGVIYTTKAFLPMLQKQTRGSCILIVSSAAGFVARGDMSSYCTSKFAVRGFGDCLLQEMAETSPHVQVTLVHPGFCSTNIFVNTTMSQQRTAANKPAASTAVGRVLEGSAAPEDLDGLMKRISSHTGASAAEVMIAGVERGATRLLLTPEAHICDFLVRLAPRLAYTKPGIIATTLLVGIGKVVWSLTPLIGRPGVPSIGVDRAVALAGAAAAALAARRARL